MRRNKERLLIEGLSLIANLKDELEDYHKIKEELAKLKGGTDELQ